MPHPQDQLASLQPKQEVVHALVTTSVTNLLTLLQPQSNLGDFCKQELFAPTYNMGENLDKSDAAADCTTGLSPPPVFYLGAISGVGLFHQYLIQL